jgi:hypothetical protein
MRNLLGYFGLLHDVQGMRAVFKSWALECLRHSLDAMNSTRCWRRLMIAARIAMTSETETERHRRHRDLIRINETIPVSRSASIRCASA